jgi:hypothetical protein
MRKKRAVMNMATLIACEYENPGKRKPMTSSPLNISTTDLMTE